MPQLHAVTDVRHFFHELVQAASKRLDVDTRQETEYYLVELLSGFSAVPDVPPLDAPLVTVLAWAMDAQGVDRMYRMRCLGDLALFRCGFFPDSLERRGVSASYVIAMGGRAYDAVALSAGKKGSPRGLASGLFAELAVRFGDFVRVLDEVRERTAMQSDGDIARLYERWRASGSPTLLRRLQRRGVVPGSRPRGWVH